MHSLVMAENLLQAVLSAAEVQEGGRIESIRLSLAEHDFCEAESLRFCFEAMAVGTAAEGVGLEIGPWTGGSGDDTSRIEIYIAQA